jgi:hypothetical protein
MWTTNGMAKGPVTGRIKNRMVFGRNYIEETGLNINSYSMFFVVFFLFFVVFFARRMKKKLKMMARRV